jgi:hypothetical protein
MAVCEGKKKAIPERHLGKKQLNPTNFDHANQ